jgi:hypothetical protein
MVAFPFSFSVFKNVEYGELSVVFNLRSVHGACGVLFELVGIGRNNSGRRRFFNNPT